MSGPPVKRGGVRNAVGWVLAVLMALEFLLAGGMKLIGHSAMVREFSQVGIGQWFRYFTGTLEVVGAIGVLIPRFSRWAALLIATVMAGAIVAHLTVLHSPPTAPALMLVLALTLAWLRR